MRLVLCLVIILQVFLPTHASAQMSLDDAAALSEAAIGRQLPSLSFTDVDGNAVELASLRGKPALISLVYTGCADVCPAIIANLRPAIEIAQNALGVDSFTVLTIGFNTRQDTPGRMRFFARSRGIDLPNWLFLSSTQNTIDRLSEALGFVIVPSAGGFDHSAQVSVIDADGRIYQQIRGGVFNPPAIVEPLKDLLFNRRRPMLSVAGIVERVKLFCTVYNPNTGRYYFNYSLFIGAAIGLACLMLVLVWLVREFRPFGAFGGRVGR
jgi:protein SCO1/2